MVYVHLDQQVLDTTLKVNSVSHDNGDVDIHVGLEDRPVTLHGFLNEGHTLQVTKVHKLLLRMSQTNWVCGVFLLTNFDMNEPAVVFNVDLSSTLLKIEDRASGFHFYLIKV